MINCVCVCVLVYVCVWCVYECEFVCVLTEGKYQENHVLSSSSSLLTTRSVILGPSKHTVQDNSFQSI